MLPNHKRRWMSVYLKITPIILFLLLFKRCIYGQGQYEAV